MLLLSKDDPFHAHGLQDLELEHLWVVYPGAEAYDAEERITVLPLRQVPDLARLDAG